MTYRWAAVFIVQSVLVVGVIQNFSRPAWGVSRTWIGGNVDWVDGASNDANWLPVGEPSVSDTAVFNTANSVSMGSANSIQALTMSGGIDLFTNDFRLTVDGLVQMVDSSTNLIIGGADSVVTADSITVNNLANLQLDGGSVVVNEESGNGLLDVNAGGELIGHGTLSMTDAVVANTTLIVNDGFITAQRTPAFIFGAPPVGTLSLTATDADTRIDLDGAGENGAVRVLRNQTLDVNIQLTDIFNGSISMFQDTTLDMSTAWILGANATLEIDNGFIDGTFPNPDTPAGTSTIAGGSLSQNGGTIAVVDTDGTLQLNTGFTMNAGTFNNEGHVIFDASSTINAGGTFNMGLSGSDLTVAAGRTVSFNQPSFNLDGNLAGTVITVSENATLNMDLGDYDNDSATNAFDGTIVLNNGAFVVTTSDAEFVMDGTLNMTNTNGSIPSWNGEPLDIGNDAGSLDADLNVAGSGSSAVEINVDFNSDADVNVEAGASLRFLSNSTVDFNTVNGGNNAEFTGAGSIVFNGPVNVNEAVTLNMTGGTVDLDGTDFVGNFINVDAPMAINAAALDSFGRINISGGPNTLDINNSVGTGVLTVNLDNATDEWTLNSAGVMNLVNDNTEATLLAGSDLNVNGTVNVTGDVRSAARLDIAGVVNVNTAGQPLRLAGGTLSSDPNTIEGGTITGVGVLGADTSRALRGFGTINTGIDFDGTAALLADNGTLTINGTILDVGTVGTFDVDGTLHVVNAWNNNVSTGVQLNGGTLNGGTITNDVAAGISGHGLVTARVINNTQLFASIADSLIFDTPADDNDWDGTTGTGEIEAVSANIELRDTGSAFGFTGTVRATNNHTAFTNGFALDFNPGSTLSLATGGTYESTNSTDLGGTVTVGSGGANIRVQNGFLTFQTGSSTTLGSNLQLINNGINIEAGATFSGAGALVIPDGSHLVADNLANIGVLLDMQGGFRPGNSEGIGRVNMFDYQQGDTGELFVELTGTSLNAFDRLVASGDVVLDGYLLIDLDLGFVPALGQTFNIITGNTVTGEFDYYDVSGMPAGLAFHVEYLANAVQLQVVNEPFFAADFDDDGDVDATDLLIWRGAFQLNQLGDADGDNDSDGADFLIWQRQIGSQPGAGAGAGFSTVPEPSTATLLALTIITLALCGAKRRPARLAGALLCYWAVVASSNCSQAQSVSISLNVIYNDSVNHALGGDWLLVAQTTSANGIAGINAIMSNVNLGGISYQSGIGAIQPYVTNNPNSVEVLYTQDVSDPASVVTDVGRGTGTPGNLPVDALNDASWDNAALIARGTFSAATPAFVANPDMPPNVTDANVLATNTAPFFAIAAAPVTAVVRESTFQRGDYNRNGTVDAADYTVWRDTLGMGVSLFSAADGSGNGLVDQADYVVWKTNFGAVQSLALSSGIAVPEPATLVLLVGSFALGAMSRRRRSQTGPS